MGRDVNDIATLQRPMRAWHDLRVDAGLLGVTILDLDRTITRRGTYSPFLLHAAIRRAPWRLLLIPAVLACMIGYRFGLMARKDLKQHMQALLLGRAVPKATVANLAESFADRVMRANVHPAMIELIARERAEGRILILATAAHRFYAAAIARRLGIDRVVATESVWRDGMLSPAVQGENCYGANKAIAVHRHLRATRLDRTAISLRCYSDDASDLPCFEASDEAIAVNPSKKLARASAARGWPVIDLR
jgi:HAD superfamily hydrolase (TIGR01490 family)